MRDVLGDLFHVAMHEREQTGADRQNQKTFRRLDRSDHPHSAEPHRGD